MTERGICVDQSRVTALLGTVTEKEAAALALCQALTGRDLNPASAVQVAGWCQDAKIPLTKFTRRGTRYSTDERSLALVRHLHPGIDAILNYRGLQKLRTAFLLPLQKKGDIVHPKWRLTQVVSGRVAMEDPNLLAFPSRDELGSRVRSCFIPREGFVFVSCDYSQIEPRVAAALSGDARMSSIFERGEDLYTSTAADLFHVRPEEVDPRRHRLPAKTTTLGVLYGIGAAKLYEELVKASCGERNEEGRWVPYFTVEDCERLIVAWFGLYPGIRQLATKTCELARRNEGVARTLMGRERHLPALFLHGNGWPELKLRQEAERQAFNHLIQGTAQEIIKKAMVRIDAEPNLLALLQIHDELLFETPKQWCKQTARRIELLMSDTLEGVSLPAKARIAADWGQVK